MKFSNNTLGLLRTLKEHKKVLSKCNSEGHFKDAFERKMSSNLKMLKGKVTLKDILKGNFKMQFNYHALENPNPEKT